MSRPLRIEYPGAVYHVTTRGNAGQTIYRDDRDRRRFLEIIEDVVKRFNWICHGYCLMTSHYHLLMETVDGNLSAGMRQVNGIYTQYVNRRHNSTGHVFQGRFKAILVDKDAYLLELCRYIVLNPVRACMVKRPGDYPWSSYRATAGQGKAAVFLSTDWVLSRFGEDEGRAREAYREFVKDGPGVDVWKGLQFQGILGDRDFCEQFSARLKERKEVKEIPRVQRYAARAGLDRLLPRDIQRSRPERNEAIRRAAMEWGYTYAEISRHTGIHYATISRIVRSSRPAEGEM
jgi:REP element-mobilizing transposase RayT